MCIRDRYWACQQRLGSLACELCCEPAVKASRKGQSTPTGRANWRGWHQPGTLSYANDCPESPPGSRRQMWRLLRMSRLVSIRTEPLSLDEVVAAVTRPEAGAIAVFSGLVRNHADGQPVTCLEYEAYPSMAEKEMAGIVAAIEAELVEVRLAVMHRIGRLQVGDLAVVCACLLYT